MLSELFCLVVELAGAQPVFVSMVAVTLEFRLEVIADIAIIGPNEQHAFAGDVSKDVLECSIHGFFPLHCALHKYLTESKPQHNCSCYA